MNLEVEHLDNKGNLKKITYKLSYLQFIKHLAFAGMGVNKSTYHAFRFLGFLIEWIPYFKFSSHKFLIPEIIKHDPTELGQLSNRIGKAIADFLAKKIYGVKYTHNYEDAMVKFGHKVKGQRPDLYCDTLTQQFSIEAKGFSRASVSAKEMVGYKLQSGQGPIPVHFSVASVAFDLYKQPKVKFHDPIGDDFEYSKDVNRTLINLYYESVLTVLEDLNLDPTFLSNDVAVPKGFVAYPLSANFLEPKLYLLIHESIVENEWSETISKMSEFSIDEKNVYIDVDGIGLCFI